MFGRAIMRLGIGPHSSFVRFTTLVAIISDIAVFVLTRDVKLQPTNTSCYLCK